jgi:periplasmic protein TonB
MFDSSKRSVLLSGLLHALAIVAILAATRVHPQTIIRAVHSVLIAPADIGRYTPKALRETQGGGGGGVRSPLPASLGRLPRQALRQFTPPVVEIVNPNPKLPMEPTIVVAPDIQLPKIDLAQYGIPNGVNGPASGGPGSGGGIGDGDGTGVGPSRGPGYGPGPGGGGATTGGGGARGSLTPPAILSKTEPEYSEDARKARVQGTVVLYVVVDQRGQPQNIQLRQSLGLGLDERAMEAVSRWRFKPATANGRPISSPVLVEVFFRLL